MGDEVDILVVDDRPENLLAIEAILARGDYRLVRASSGPDALRKILEHDFAVILLDVVMPGMDGFDVVELVKRRERSRHTPIIFLSAAGANMDFIYRGYTVGAVDYLTKPIDADVLRAKVAIFVELFRLRVAEQRSHEERYRNLAEAIPQIVWTASADGGITYINRRWEEYSGQSAAEALGWGWSAALAPEDAARWREGLAHGSLIELEHRLRRCDGARRWHLCRAVPERDARGRIAGWLGTFTDCDDLKRAVEARDEFLSTASHELRTPLTTLQLQLQSLAREVAAPPDARQRKVDSCLRQSSRLIALVASLFDFSRLASGQLALHREELDLVLVANEVVERVSELAARADSTVRVDADAAVTGCWDRLRVEQVIENLLGNAIKYAASSPIAVVVRGDEHTATIEVTDHGPGIARDDLPRIFEPFQRATASSSWGGLGLGLYIAREYARAHGGTIAVTSIPSERTTFTVELPRTCESSSG